MDLNQWLEQKGLGKYADVLAENEIDDVDILADISEEELGSLGIPLGARKKILRAIAGEAQPSTPPPSDQAPASPSQADPSPEPEAPEASHPVALDHQALAQPAPSEPVEHPQVVQAVDGTPPAPADLSPPDSFPASTGMYPAVVPAALSSRVESKGNSRRKTTAFLVAAAIHAALIAIAATLTIFAASRDEPEIIASIAPPSMTPQQEMKKKAVQKQVKRSPSSASAAAAPMAQMMRANAEARFTAPDITRTSTGPLGVGEGDLGAGAFGVGSGLGAGSGDGGSFFGTSSKGNRFLFVLDHSKSMSGAQIALRNKELGRSLSSLKGVQYQVLLFAGAAIYAEQGWSVSKGDATTVTGPGGKKYEFTSKRHADYNFKGPDSALPKTRWLDANPTNIQKTMNFISRAPVFLGTDWEMALRIGHHMEPPPDVIFFMADGTGGNSPGPILEMNRRRGSPVINTIAMQTNEGAKEFSAVAKGTKGTFTIVGKNGKATRGSN